MGTQGQQFIFKPTKDEQENYHWFYALSRKFRGLQIDKHRPVYFWHW